MITIGIDIGSRNTKLVVFDPTRGIPWSNYISTDVSPLSTAESLLAEARRITELRPDQTCRIYVTGYGRHLFKLADKAVSEISCHAAGIRHLIPEARTIIDIGGQDSKLISLDADGNILDFVMNDKCAAGTGRFLEMTAIRLDCELADLSVLAGQATQELKLNSTCVVFAESEIIGLMSQETSRANIARAVHMSIARRIASQMAGIALVSPLVFTGGVAMSDDITLCLETVLKTPILRPAEPEITGALGAALLAAK